MTKAEFMRNTYKVFKVPENLAVIKVSARKYRIIKLVHDGKSYSNFNKPITGVREFEFVSGPLTHPEMIGFMERQAVD